MTPKQIAQLTPQELERYVLLHSINEQRTQLSELKTGIPRKEEEDNSRYKRELKERITQRNTIDTYAVSFVKSVPVTLNF